MSKKTVYVVVAGDSGVYSGYVSGLDALGADGRVVLEQARHLRRYYVAGHVGDGSAIDLANLGLADDSPSITKPSETETVLLGVRHMFVVSASALASFTK